MTITKRRTLLDIASRHVQPGSGSSPRFLKERTANMRWPDPEPILSPLSFAVAGAVATRHYMPERVTQDLDIVILASDSNAANLKLVDAGFERQGELAIGSTTWRAPDGHFLYLVEGHEAWWPEAIAAAQENRDVQGLPILPLPYLVLMKFRAGRVQDLADISRMLGQAGKKRLAAVRDLFDREQPGDREELESLIKLGQLEYQKSADKP